jgi:hypothetical protein
MQCDLSGASAARTAHREEDLGLGDDLAEALAREKSLALEHGHGGDSDDSVAAGDAESPVALLHSLEHGHVV